MGIPTTGAQWLESGKAASWKQEEGKKEEGQMKKAVQKGKCIPWSRHSSRKNSKRKHTRIAWCYIKTGGIATDTRPLKMTILDQFETLSRRQGVI